MDESFLLRAKRLLDGQPARRFGHGALLAAVTARQSASPTARAAATPDRDSEGTADKETLIALLSDPGGAAQGGCFNRAVAKRPVNQA